MNQIKSIVFLYLTFLSFSGYSQSFLGEGKYLIYFIDKANTIFDLNDPYEFLTARSIQRRSFQGIEVDSTDLPINPQYINGVRSITGSIIHQSKWMNAVFVEGDSTTIAEVLKLPFVKGHDRLLRKGSFNRKNKHKEEKIDAVDLSSEKLGRSDYGEAWIQTNQINAHKLHDMGYRGSGMMVAVFDAGFDNVDSMVAFENLRQRGGIVYSADMVDPGNDIYEEHRHGTLVLSIMAAEKGSEYTGMATAAEYLLFRTEDVNSETRAEEINWLVAAEKADSLGADIINTSLTYKTFDDTVVADYSPSDMGGSTSYISRASTFAHRKGILCVTSGGNDGARSWNTIGTPADTDSILTVGSVDSFGLRSGFSSLGPTADGRTKPEIVAMGERTAVIYPNDVVARGNGTSFSAPVIAGYAACLWPLLTKRTTNYGLRDRILRSSTNYNQPNDSIGHGIPDFEDILKDLGTVQDLVRIFPNPYVYNYGPTIFPSPLNMVWNTDLLDTKVEISTYQSDGKKIASLSYQVQRIYDIFPAALFPRNDGLIIVQIQSNKGSETHKLVLLHHEW